MGGGVSILIKGPKGRAGEDELGFEVGWQRSQTRKNGRARGQNDGRNEDDGGKNLDTGT